jgi:hypothetical protein
MRKGGVLLGIAAGGMELSWLYAWATFLTTSLFHRPYPFAEAIGSFALAAILAHLSRGRGWRIISVLAFRALGFIPCLLRIVRVFSSWSTSLSNQPWLAESFDAQTASTDWLVIVLVLSWTIFFWSGGVRFVRRGIDYFTLCSRFDRGLAAFFVLFLAKFLFWVRGGIKLEDPVSQLLIFPFFIFSLLAIGLVRNRTSAPKDFLPGYQGLGVILSFSVVILLFGTGLVFLFLPYLTMAAEAGYGILKIAATPVGSLLLMVLRFLFAGGVRLEPPVPDQPQIKKPELPASADTPWWLELLAKIVGYALWAIVGLALLAIIGVALYYLYRWLLSRTTASEKRESLAQMILSWAERLRTLLNYCRRWLVRRMQGYTEARQVYGALLGWGRRSGLPRSFTETPREYGLRLRQRFPVLNREIESIIEAFHTEVYAETASDETTLAQVRSSWSRLRSPIHWPRRVKTWFMRTPSYGPG